MNKIKEFLVKMVTSHSGISSKRVCGVIGFIVIVFVLIYCTINVVQAPVMIDTFIYAICILLGVDSVTGIFKNFTNNEK
jgi:hypothetical protein